MNIYDNKLAVHLGRPSDAYGFVWLYDKSEMDAAMRTVNDIMNFKLI